MGQIKCYNFLFMKTFNPWLCLSNFARYSPSWFMLSRKLRIWSFPRCRFQLERTAKTCAQIRNVLRCIAIFLLIIKTVCLLPFSLPSSFAKTPYCRRKTSSISTEIFLANTFENESKLWSCLSENLEELDCFLRITLILKNI